MRINCHLNLQKKKKSFKKFCKLIKFNFFECAKFYTFPLVLRLIINRFGTFLYKRTERRLIRMHVYLFGH